MQQFRYNKTFTTTTYWIRDADGNWTIDPNRPGDAGLDEQTRDWVQRTGNIIIHPGQLGMHKQWMTREMTSMAVTLGVVVLYVEGSQNAIGQADQAGTVAAYRDAADAADCGPAARNVCTLSGLEHIEPLPGDLIQPIGTLGPVAASRAAPARDAATRRLSADDAAGDAAAPAVASPTLPGAVRTARIDL